MEHLSIESSVVDGSTIRVGNNNNNNPFGLVMRWIRARLSCNLAGHFAVCAWIAH